MVLYVTRHGETDYNVLGRYCGSTDAALNDAGVKQAHDLARRVKGMKFDAVASSPMLRARQTANIVGASLNMPYAVYAQFAERNVGVYEGLTRDEAKERYPHMWSRQCTAKPDDAPDGGETLRQACGRIDGGIARLRADFAGMSILLICHGFTSRAVNRYCRGLSFEEMAGFTLGNCEIVSYALEP
jgi:probable phosphoglycerate mutase